MKILTPITLCAIALMACDNTPAADWQGWPTETAQGVNFAVPPGMSVAVDEASIELTSDTKARRIDTVSLYVERLAPAITRADLIIVDKGNTPAPYIIAERGAGSGGVEYGLFTSKRIDTRTINLFANIQTENGPPQFAAAWAVWESLEAVDQAASDVSTSRAQ